VIVRYDNALLPASTHNYLGTKGWSGYHAFVMYAHLNRILCSEGQSLGPSQEVGKLGNSGNSSGAHLHLELRFGKDANATWPNIRNGLVSPVHLFLR
jgi:murein DD-endopeptidase MepM/ murein hydrolase activator NlpD